MGGKMWFCIHGNQHIKSQDNNMDEELMAMMRLGVESYLFMVLFLTISMFLKELYDATKVWPLQLGMGGCNVTAWSATSPSKGACPGAGAGAWQGAGAGPDSCDLVTHSARSRSRPTRAAPHRGNARQQWGSGVVQFWHWYWPVKIFADGILETTCWNVCSSKILALTDS